MRARSPGGFTLVELMVSTAIIALIMAILLQMTGQTAATWRYGAAKAEQFQEARRAFETVTRRLGDATLNTYWDYYRPPNATNTLDINATPVEYARQSELRFRVVKMSTLPSPLQYRTGHGVFFQAPFGTVEDTEYLSRMDNLLNSWGYFVEVEDVNGDMPSFLEEGATPKFRSRLKEFRQSSERFSLYHLRNARMGPNQERSPDPLLTNGIAEVADDAWFRDEINLEPEERPVRTLAENILAMVILPKLTPQDEAARRKANYSQVMLSPEFTYHSKQNNNYGRPALNPDEKPGELNPKNQLPPVVQVAMVAIDEAGAQRLADLARTNPEQLGLEEILEPDGVPLFERAERLEPSSGDPEGDLGRLEVALRERKINYRVFTSNVAVRGAKWSSASSN